MAVTGARLMRFYSFTNYYLSSIQIGIQTAHALGEMVAKYQILSNGASKVCYEWLHNHKTMVLLNGGNSQDLRDLWTLLSDERNTFFPVSKFSEDEQSLDGALTCIAIVLPEELYSAEWIKPGTNGNDVGYWWYETDKEFGYGKQIRRWEAELLTVIKRLPLAR